MKSKKKKKKKKKSLKKKIDEKETVIQNNNKIDDVDNKKVQFSQGINDKNKDFDFYQNRGKYSNLTIL